MMMSIMNYKLKRSCLRQETDDGRQMTEAGCLGAKNGKRRTDGRKNI